MKICFPVTNRVHLSRQRLLLNHLARRFIVSTIDIEIGDGDMSSKATASAYKFEEHIKNKHYDLAIVRGDRYELLGIASVLAYRQIPIVHIEGFDLSGVIDNKVRYAISYLSDYHFVTNEESLSRAKLMGFEHVWDFGSLDCEYALSVQGSNKPAKPYILVLWHQVPSEDFNEILGALNAFPEYEIIGIKGNKDYAESAYKEEYSPEDFIKLLKGASCLVGNSSCGIKEAGVLGIPVVNIGSRQANRLRTKNIQDANCVQKDIEDAIKYQLSHKVLPDFTYFKQNTSWNIANTILNISGP